MTITINVKTKETQGKAKLDIRRDLQGNYIINDHIDIDIVYKVGEGKVLLFPKNDAKDSDIVYQSQDRFFEFMIKSGVIESDSVKGTAMIGVMQGEILENNSTGNTTQIVIYTIAQYIDTERKYFKFSKGFREDEMERLFDPEDKDSTELGEVPQKAKKGSINQSGSQGGSFGAGMGLFEVKSYYAGEHKQYEHHISFHSNGSIVITGKGGKADKGYIIEKTENPADFKYIKKVFQGRDDFLKMTVLDDLIRGRYGVAKWKTDSYKGRQEVPNFEENDDEPLDFNF